MDKLHIETITNLVVIGDNQIELDAGKNLAT
jgi:hypothetical protein